MKEFKDIDTIGDLKNEVRFQMGLFGNISVFVFTIIPAIFGIVALCFGAVNGVLSVSFYVNAAFWSLSLSFLLVYLVALLTLRRKAISPFAIAFWKGWKLLIRFVNVGLDISLIVLASLYPTHVLSMTLIVSAVVLGLEVIAIVFSLIRFLYVRETRRKLEALPDEVSSMGVNIDPNGTSNHLEGGNKKIHHRPKIALPFKRKIKAADEIKVEATEVEIVEDEK